MIKYQTTLLIKINGHMHFFSYQFSFMCVSLIEIPLFDYYLSVKKKKYIIHIYKLHA